MKAIVVTDQAAGTAGMKLVERPEPQGAALANLSGANYGDVVVQVHASGCGGAVRRPGKPPRLVPLPAAESVVAPVSPFPTRDAFSIGDSKRNTKQEYGVVTLRQTRSHDRGTHAEWNQSPAPRRLAAKASAVWTALRGCPGLAPVLGSQGRK
jgi:hypothetical protein